MRNRLRHNVPWWHNRLKGRGYRITVPRQAVLEVLSQTDRHLSAEDIYIGLRKRDSEIGLTTVYRTLELLKEMGIVRRFEFGDGRARYELSVGPRGKEHHHHHLVCTRCGRVIDYTDFIKDELKLLGRVEKELEERFGFEIRNHTLQFLGLCDRCRKEGRVR